MRWIQGLVRTLPSLTLAGAALLSATPAAGIVLDDPANYTVRNLWSAIDLGIPGPLGAMMFSPDGQTLYVVGASEQAASALYAVPVTRDPISHQVTGLGPAAVVVGVFQGDPAAPGLDAGCDLGPAGTLFYTYWPAHVLGQRPGGPAGPETQYPMAAIGLPSSIAGLAFSPVKTDPNTGFAMLQCSTWQGAGLFDIELAPLGGGLFQPLSASQWVTLPRQGTGAIQYFPSGPLAGQVLYVNWDFGEVMVLFVDPATGLAYDADSGLPSHGTANPITTRIAHDFGVGPWGLEFDPLSLDFFVATFAGEPADTIVQIGQTGLPTSLLARITSIVPDGDGFRIRWFGPPGWTHRVRRASEPVSANWSEAATVIAAPFSNERWVEGTGGKAGFYRIECVQQ